MWCIRVRLALVLLAVLATGGVVHPQAPAPEDRNSPESLRRFLAARGALSPPNWWTFSVDLRQLYSRPSISKPAGCPLGEFRDQPATASPSAVNVFVVDFKSDPEAFCRDAPNPRSCLGINDSCVAVGTSVFCDYAYLQRRETIAAVAYHSAWKGLSGMENGQNALFIPLPHDALTDLASSTIAARNRTAPRPDQPITAEAKRLARNAPSTVYDLAQSVSLLVPVLHEIGHIEQGYCGRGLTTRKEDEDFLARMMLTGDVDWRTQTKLYETLTCSSLARNELAADLRSVDMMLMYLEDEAPKAASTPRFEFSAQVDAASRRQLQRLARWTREIALLSLMQGLEYDVLIYQNSAWGLSLASKEPDGTSLQAYTNYYLDAGGDQGIPRVRGHLEPPFRAIMLAKYLDVERLSLVNLGRSTAVSHLRLAPFVIGRIRAINKRDCGSASTLSSFAGLDDFVFESLQGATRSLGIKLSGPGSLDDANQLLAKFLTPGANYRALTQPLQPGLGDLRAIFNQPFADRAFRYYSRLWSADTAIAPKPGQTEVLVRAETSDRLRMLGGSDHLPGGYEKIAGEFRPGLTIYSWAFLAPGSNFGMAYNALYYVNGHWVFVPKPHQVE
jgi:hypothetical protein